MYVWLNLKAIKFYLINFAHNSTDNQAIYLLGERSSFGKGKSTDA
jgi:hypothetical protein